MSTRVLEIPSTIAAPYPGIHSLKHAIIATAVGSTAYVETRTGRPVDIDTIAGRCLAVHDVCIKMSEDVKDLLVNWEESTLK